MNHMITLESLEFFFFFTHIYVYHTSINFLMGYTIKETSSPLLRIQYKDDIVIIVSRAHKRLDPIKLVET